MDLNQVTVSCTDYDRSVEFYQTLGLRLIVNSPPRYARFETPSGSTLSIHNGTAPASETTFCVESNSNTVVGAMPKLLIFFIEISMKTCSC